MTYAPAFGAKDIDTQRRLRDIDRGLVSTFVLLMLLGLTGIGGLTASKIRK